MEKRSVDHYKEELRQEGFEVTPQRLEVIRALLELDHPTAKSVREESEKRHPTISQSTIYTTLNLLEEIGELTPIPVETETRYEIHPAPHAHLIHEETGEVEDLKVEMVQEKLSELTALAPEATTRVELNFYIAKEGPKEEG